MIMEELWQATATMLRRAALRQQSVNFDVNGVNPLNVSDDEWGKSP
jgi:hypothetical protein